MSISTKYLSVPLSILQIGLPSIACLLYLFFSFLNRLALYEISCIPATFLNMKYFILLSAAVAIGLSSAQDIDTGDYPAACQQYCGPVAARSSACDANNDDGDDSETNCICNGSGMSTAIPRCDACVGPFRVPGDDDFSDISELLQACGLSTTSLSNAPTPTTTYVFTTTSTDDVSGQ